MADRQVEPEHQLSVRGLKSAGFDTLLTTTAFVPALCGSDERAFAITREAQHHDIFVLPVVSPAVLEGQSRLRLTITAAHEASDIESARDVITFAGRKIGVIGWRGTPSRPDVPVL